MNAGTGATARRCWAAIDLAALARNLRNIRAALPPHMRYVSVVKADAYGHGLHHVAAQLMHVGVDLFAVANVSEAAALREVGPGWPILVLGPLLAEEDEAVAAYDLIATVSSEEEVARLARVGAAAGTAVRVHLKVDTGMGRAGAWYEGAAALHARIRAERSLVLAGICTHFAAPDEDPEYTARQRQRFLAVLDQCGEIAPEGLLIHADNSAGLGTMPGTSRFNAVRIGLLQFGIQPRAGSLLSGVKTEPVFSFHTRVVLVKALPAGTTISYGRTHTLTRPSRVAILCAGYGDGLPRAASNRAQVLIHGRRCPVLGRITMDQTVVDVTDVPGVAAGDPVVLVGRQHEAEISVTEFSRWSDTIPWETLCSVTKRVPRLYQTILGT